MEQEDNRSSIQRELNAKEVQIKRRIDNLESELVSMPAALKSAITNHPLVGVGAAIAVGLVVSLMVRGRKHNRSDSSPAHQQLVEQYIEAIARDVRKNVRRGKDPEEAIRKSLRGRAPVIFYAPSVHSAVSEDARGVTRRTFDIALKSILALAAKTSVDFLISRVNVSALQDKLVSRGGDGAAGQASAHSHEGDGAAKPSTMENESLDL